MDIENTNNPVERLVHLYEDGAFNRRELVRRIATYTGSIATAIAALGAFALPAEAQACPDDVRVPPDASDLESEPVTFPGQAGTVYGYLSRLRSLQVVPAQPAVLVIHENRGLNDHIKDVTRRVARAGFVALGIDLLSRAGGTDWYPDPADALAAYNSLNSQTHLEDMQSAVEFLRRMSFVDGSHLGAVGFCAGGGNCFNLAVTTPLQAAVVFYGAPPNPVEQVGSLAGPVLMIYAELDRGFTSRVPAAVTALLQAEKTFGLHVYEGARHAFHNDTGALYNAEAACDAWAKTIAFFNRHLRPPADANEA
ncbi:MAG TPA: dienelactone hydrolase family protein [Bryobacteraceae bacterium]|nr:dienelactone hydrolase family protein [Bryobacteraceae bacterium]